MIEERVVLSLDAMATRFEVVLFGKDSGRLRAAAEEALDEIKRLEEQLSAYDPHSELSQVNDQAADRPVKIDPRLFRFIEHAAHLSEETYGAFDMTITPLLRVWGFKDGQGQTPDQSSIDSARELVGMKHVILNKEDFTVRFDKPGVELDPGAVGKGYAVERAAAILREIGITSALIHGGTSTVCAIGSPPEKSGWPVAVRNPLQEEEFLSIVSLCNSSLSVSSVKGKSFTDGDKVFGHVIDPRTGTPTQSALSAAVIGESPTDCDALSTALLVLGEQWLPEFTQKWPGYRGLVAVYDSDAKSIRVAHTPPPHPPSF